MNYNDYLKSAHWRDFRRAAIDNADRKCCLCGVRDMPLGVHHNNYDCLFAEKFHDVAVLCRQCHDRVHDVLPTVKEIKRPEPDITPVNKLRKRLETVVDVVSRERIEAQIFIYESDLPAEDKAKRLMEL